MDTREVKYPGTCKELNDELPKDELIRRLKAVCRAFQNMDQDDNKDKKEYEPLAKHLANEAFIDHDSKEVRLLTACCIADLFRIFAPEPPYDHPDQLKVSIFTMLIENLKGIEHPEQPSFKRYFYLLENLAFMKTFTLVVDLECCAEITVALFKLFFRIVNVNHSERVRSMMLDMMCPLITEADTLGQSVLDVLLINIVEPYKITGLTIDMILVLCDQAQNEPAYELAKNIILKTSSTLGHQAIRAFFRDALLMNNTTETNLGGHIYDLIPELFEISPALLTSTLPHFELKLKSQEESERLAMVHALTRLFVSYSSELHVTHKELWSLYVGRFRDIHAAIRQEMAEASHKLFIAHPEVREQIGGELKNAGLDVDEMVRFRAVDSAFMIAKHDLSILSEELLDMVKGRALDKKPKVRREALTALGHLYKRVSAPLDPDATDKQRTFATAQNKRRLSFVPRRIMQAYAHAGYSDRLLIERLFSNYLVPHSLSPEKRMQMFLDLYTLCRSKNKSKHIPPPGSKPNGENEDIARFIRLMFSTRRMLLKTVKQLVDVCATPPGEKKSATLAEAAAKEVQSRVDGLVDQLAGHMTEGPSGSPNSAKTYEEIGRLASALSSDKRVRGVVNKLLSPTCKANKAEAHTKEAMRLLGVEGAQHPITALLGRVAPILFDQTAVSSLVDLVSQDLSPESVDVLLLVADSFCVELFHTEETISSLGEMINCDDRRVSAIALKCLHHIITPSLNSEFKSFCSNLPSMLEAHVHEGSPKQCKHAVRCLSKFHAKSKPLKPLFDWAKRIVSGELSPQVLPNALVVLAELSLADSSSFDIASLVGKHLINGILLAEKGWPREKPGGSDDDWCAFEDLSQKALCKMLMLKCIGCWQIGCHRTHMRLQESKPSATALQAARKTLSTNSFQTYCLFLKVLRQGGDATPKPTLKSICRENQRCLLANTPSICSSFVSLAATPPFNSFYPASLHPDAFCNFINVVVFFIFAATARQPARSYVRLTVSKLVLRMATLQLLYEELPHHLFFAVAFTLNDPVREVRWYFGQKLRTYLNSMQLSLRFMSMWCLCGRERDPILREVAQNSLTAAIHVRREFLKKSPAISTSLHMYSILPDYMVPFAIHLLAHSPDYKHHEDVTALESIKDCVWFALEPLAAKNEAFNAAFMQKAIERIKQCKDRVAGVPAADGSVCLEEETNNKLYAVCDVALILLMTKCPNLTLKEYTGEPALPRNLFSHIGEYLELNTEHYLPPRLRFSPPRNKIVLASLPERVVRMLRGSDGGGSSQSSSAHSQRSVASSFNDENNPTADCVFNRSSSPLNRNAHPKSTAPQSRSGKAPAAVRRPSSPDTVVSPAKKLRTSGRVLQSASYAEVDEDEFDELD